jgi:hypothetical protein
MGVKSMRLATILILSFCLSEVVPGRCLADEKDDLVKQQKEELQSLVKQVRELREEMKGLREELRALQKRVDDNSSGYLGFEVEEKDRQVVVTEAPKDGRPAKGWVVRAVGGKRIETLADFRQMTGCLRVGDKIRVFFVDKAGNHQADAQFTVVKRP